MGHGVEHGMGHGVDGAWSGAWSGALVWGTAKGALLTMLRKPFQLAERQPDATWHKKREQCVGGEGRRDASWGLRAMQSPVSPCSCCSSSACTGAEEQLVPGPCTVRTPLCYPHAIPTYHGTTAGAAGIMRLQPELVACTRSTSLSPHRHAC